MYTPKKILSFVFIFLILKDILSIGTVSWIGTLDVTNFAINGSTATLELNPWDGFYVSLEAWNNVGENIKNVFFHLNLWNSYFSYDGTNHKTQVNNNDTISPLPITAFSGTEVSSEVTNASFPTIWTTFATKKARFINISTSTGFQISSNIPIYQNTLTTWFNAKRTSDSTDVISSSIPHIVYVNVKPHITSYSFSKSSIIGNGADSVDLTLRVKDYNGCTNIDGGVVTANLTALWLSSSEPLVYNSCDIDGKTAIFKKIGITTLATVWDKIFTYTDFTAKDRDNNTTDPNDPNTTFGSEDLKTNITLTVATPVAPVVTIASTTPTVIGNIGSSTVSFSADKGWTYKVVHNGNGSCSSGTVVTDWMAYATGSTINSVITGTSLIEWVNTVYTCIQSSVGDIGSANTTITKDVVAPTVSLVSVTPASVITTDSSVSFQCNESGTYRVVMNTLDSGYLATTANATNTVTLFNSNMSVGTNAITLYCQDEAGNIATNTTFSVSKTLPTPAMTTSGITLVDNDVEWDGVDGRDLKVTWDSSIGSSFTGFDSYRIYILPTGTTFTGTYLWLVINSGATTWTGSSYIINDSLWNPLSWGDYVTYVAIMGTSGQLGTPASATGTLTYDTVPHPSTLSASFTSTGILSVKFNTNLKTDTWSHSATGFVYQIGTTTYTGISVSSVSTDTINITIPDTGNTSATGTLSIATGSVWGVPVAGSFNYETGGVIITDATSPTITTFSTGTTAYYTNFYSGSLLFNYTVSENLVWAGGTKIVFTRVWGNIDTSKTAYITTPVNLLAGSHTETINLVSLGLVSGVYYDVTFIAKDLSWNNTTSTPINIKFDNVGPSIVSTHTFWPQSVLGIGNPTFSWFTTTDDSGNGSWVKGYNLRIYTGSTTYTSWQSCTGTYTETIITNPAQLSQQITLANLYNYAWTVSAYDNMENMGTLSSCDNFYINTNVPSFSTTSITDTILGSTTYTKWGDTLVIKSTIANTDSGHIWLNATSLKDSSYGDISCATPVYWVTCAYVWNVATYTFTTGALSSLSSGVKQSQFTATNISWVNTGTTLASITLDNTAPTIGTNTLFSPISGTFWGTWVTISWTPGNITDNIGLAYIKLEYFDWTTWNLIGTGANSGSYPWDISTLTSWPNFQVRISAYDKVGLSSTFTGWVFALDRIAPVVPTTALTYPSASGIKLKWGSNINITWNSGSIVDTWGLTTNPITLSYSIDGGTNYTPIATNLANNGSYTWTIPSLNNATMKIKIEVADNVGNKSNDISDNIFEVDSTVPVITVSYAGLGGSTPQTNSYINNSGADEYLHRIHTKIYVPSEINLEIYTMEKM